MAALAIVCAGFAVYANSLHGPMLLDDQRTLGENPSIRDLSSLGAVLHPPPQNPVTGRPLVNLSFAVNYAMGGFAVEGYHLMNIAVHVLAGLVLFGVLRRTLAKSAGSAASDRLALFCTLAWVLHPLNTEAVNYITQRTESMMGLFYLLTVYAAIRALESRRFGRWELIAGISALCGVACKETTLTVGLVVILWDRTFAFGSFRDAWAARRRLYGLIAASWLLFAVFARELPFFAARGFEEHVSRWVYLLNQGPMITQYLQLALVPRGLIFDYGLPLPLTLADAWPTLTVVILLLAATGVALVRQPAIGFWGAWFFITLAPASSLIPIPTEGGAERRMYLPLIAVMVAMAMLAHALLRRIRSETLRTRAAATIAALALAALAVVTVQRNRDYQTGLAIWQTVLDRRPTPRAHEHLSMFLRDEGRTEEAIAHLRTASPGSPNARHALASALFERGDLAGSIAEFREFIRLRPDDPHIIQAREEFAFALLKADDSRGAAEQFGAIVALEPGYTRGHLGLADALQRGGDRDAAKAEYRAAARLQPDNVVALVGLGLLQASSGETDEAVVTLRHALNVEPRDLIARRQLLEIFLTRRQFPELEREARALLTYAPNDAEGHNLLGVALASQNRFAPAMEAFTQALRLDPGNAGARNNLARANEALRLQGRR